MSALLDAYNTIIPVLLFLLAGYLTQKSKLVPEVYWTYFNRILYHVFLPCTLFKNIYLANNNSDTPTRLIVFALAVTLGTFMILMLTISFFTKDNRRKGVYVQAIFRGNFLSMGLPILSNLYGEIGMITIGLQVAIIIPLYNILAVIGLEWFRKAGINVKGLFMDLVRNPFMIVSFAALLLRIFNLTLPSQIYSCVDTFGTIATTLALFVLGGSFKFTQLKDNLWPVMITTFIKLIGMPFAVMVISILAGFRDVELACILVMVGSSTAVASYAMCQQMGADDVLANQIVVVTTATCILTQFVWIFALRYLGFML